MDITERDKKILYVLGMILLVTLFFVIGIRPLNRRINTLDKQIDAAVELHDTIKMKLFQLDMLEEFRHTGEEMIRDLSEDYYGAMLPAETGRLITDLALSYDLRVNNLRIDAGKEPVNLLAYVHSKAFEAQKQALLESKTASSGATAGSDGLVDVEELASIRNDYGIYQVTDTTSSEVYATTIDLDVVGDEQQEKALLDELITNRSMRVISYKWAEMTGLPYQYVDGELTRIGGENSRRLIVRFDLYMYDGTAFETLTAN